MDLTKAEFSGKLARGIRLEIDDDMRTDDYRAEIVQVARKDFSERVGVNGSIQEMDSKSFEYAGVKHLQSHVINRGRKVGS
jgi:hypothetical protein